MPNRYISETERKAKFSYFKGRKMPKTLQDYKKEFEEKFVNGKFDVIPFNEGWTDKAKVWQYVEGMAREVYKDGYYEGSHAEIRRIHSNQDWLKAWEAYKTGGHNEKAK